MAKIDEKPKGTREMFFLRGVIGENGERHAPGHITEVTEAFARFCERTGKARTATAEDKKSAKK